MAEKCTTVEKAQRIQQVQQWLLEGKGIKTICHLTSDWNLDRRSIERYVSEAWEFIHDCAQATLREKVSRQLTRLDSTICRAIQKGDLKAECKAIEVQSKILGIENAPITPEERADKLSDSELELAISKASDEAAVH